MQNARSGLFVTLNSGKLWAIEGKDAESNTFTEVYDPAIDSWSEAPMAPLKSIEGCVKGCKF